MCYIGSKLPALCFRFVLRKSSSRVGVNLTCKWGVVVTQYTLNTGGRIIVRHALVVNRWIWSTQTTKWLHIISFTFSLGILLGIFGWNDQYQVFTSVINVLYFVYDSPKRRNERMLTHENICLFSLFFFRISLFEVEILLWIDDDVIIVTKMLYKRFLSEDLISRDLNSYYAYSNGLMSTKLFTLVIHFAFSFSFDQISNSGIFFFRDVVIIILLKRLAVNFKFKFAWPNVFNYYSKLFFDEMCHI